MKRLSLKTKENQDQKVIYLGIDHSLYNVTALKSNDTCYYGLTFLFSITSEVTRRSRKQRAEVPMAQIFLARDEDEVQIFLARVQIFLARDEIFLASAIEQPSLYWACHL